MRNTLKDYILSTTGSQKLVTGNFSLSRRISKSMPELADRIFTKGATVESGDFVNLDEKISLWLKTMPNPDLNKIVLKKYSNVIDEAEAIFDFSKSNKIIVATPNKFLAKTLAVISGDLPDPKIELNKTLWLKTGESIFMHNCVQAIDYCCNHPWIDDNFKSNLFYKNHIVRNQIIARFTEFTKEFKARGKHTFNEFLSIHYEFIKSVSKYSIENNLVGLYPSSDLIDQYQYLGILPKLLNDVLEKKESKNSTLEVIGVDEIPWVTDEPVWLGGINAEWDFNGRYLTECVQYFSYNHFEQGCSTHPNPAFLSCKTEDYTSEYGPYTYYHYPPCPKIELRKSSFAINHVTKLLNNPYNFYIESILKLKSYNFHPNHIVGIMVHSVFEEHLKKNNNFKDLNKIKTEINSLLNKNHFSKIDYLIVTRKVETMLANLCEILKDSSKVYSEHEGMQKITHNGREYFLHGRADLIYEKDGRAGVIDFKTGNPPSWVNIVNGSAPQISIAMLMLRFGGFLGKEIVELADSGFISPKGFFRISHDDFILQSAIDGIKELITVFWEQDTPYYLHINDINSPYRLLARNTQGQEQNS